MNVVLVEARAAILQEKQVLRISAEKQMESLKEDFFTL